MTTQEKRTAPTTTAATAPATHKTSSERVEERLTRPIRAAVFGTVPAADRVVADLFAAGFAHEQITVMCSNETRQRHFEEFEHQQPAGTHTKAAAATGSVVGAAVASAVAVAGLVTTGGIAVLAAGGLAAWTGGVVGGLIGAMMTRGVEKELANFYDQEITAGKILVAVEVDESPDQLKRLREVERIMAAEGVQPMPLPEG